MKKKLEKHINISIISGINSTFCIALKGYLIVHTNFFDFYFFDLACSLNVNHRKTII